MIRTAKGIDAQEWDDVAEIQIKDAMQAGLRGACSRCAHLPLESTEKDCMFYEECLESARQNRHNPERDDLEYVYRNQARACDEWSENIRKIGAGNNMFWGLASPEDILRVQAIWMG